MAFSIVQLETGDLQITIGADFLPEDAWGIHELLERTASGTRVALDFRRVRNCHDFALSLLARDLIAGRIQVSFHGTSQHQERVLAYFGVARTAAQPGADFDAA